MVDIFFAFKLYTLIERIYICIVFVYTLIERILFISYYGKIIIYWKKLYISQKYLRKLRLLLL